jgi:hypothetical protein
MYLVEPLVGFILVSTPKKRQKRKTNGSAQGSRATSPPQLPPQPTLSAPPPPEPDILNFFAKHLLKFNNNILPVQQFLQSNFAEGDATPVREVSTEKATVERLDQHTRANNIVIYNVPGSGPAEQVKILFPAHVAQAIQNIGRLGRRPCGEGNVSSTSRMRGCANTLT